jgi:hypothetical protein
MIWKNQSEGIGSAALWTDTLWESGKIFLSSLLSTSGEQPLLRYPNKRLPHHLAACCDHAEHAYLAEISQQLCFWSNCAVTVYPSDFVGSFLKSNDW